MECDLDKLVEDYSSSKWTTVLQSCDDMIKSCIDPLKRKIEKAYSIDESHELVFGKSGAMIKVKGEKSYKPLKPGVEIVFEKLERGEYALADLIDIEIPCLGVYEGEKILVLTGPYGQYVSCGDRTIGIKSLKDKGITLETVQEILLQKEEEQKTVLRELNEEMSVRKSKYGNYIYYKTAKMKKPKFVNLKKCPYDVLTEEKINLLIDWVKTQ
jgi:DNA topoisomerase-1